MFTRWHLVRKELVPKPSVLALMGIALGLTLIGLTCSVIFAFTAEVDDPPATGAAMFGCFLMPVVLLLLLVGTFRDKRPIPRAVLWLTMSLLIALSTIVLAIAMASDPELGWQGSTFIFLAFGAPTILLVLAPAIYYAAKGRKGLIATLNQKRAEIATARIQAAGQLSLVELGEDLALGRDATVQFLQGLIATGQFSGTVDPISNSVYSVAALSARRLELLGVLKAHGQIHLDTLGRELDAPQALLKDWIYELVRLERFSGYINWKTSMLYSAERAKLGSSDRCPSCGGHLTLAGKGIVSCSHCGAEILL